MNEATEGRAFATVEDPKHPWLEARLAGIGGSDVASVLGLSPYTSAFNLFGQRIGLVEPPAMNRFMYWGSVLEPVVATWYRDETGRVVVPPAHIARIMKQEEDGGELTRKIAQWVHGTAMLEYGPDDDGRVIFRCRRKGHEQMLFTPDYFIYDKDEGVGLLEIKTADSRMRPQWEDGAPPHYDVQLQAGLRVFDLKWGAFAVLFGGNDAGDFDIEAKPEVGDEIAAATADFWRRLKENDPPPADGSESTRDALKQIYPQGSGDTIALDAEAALLVDNYEAHKQQEKAAKSLKRNCETQLMALLGSHTQGALPDGRTVYLSDIAEQKIEAFTKKGYRRMGIRKAKKS